MARITKANFKKALKGSGGIYSHVARKLGVSRQAVSQYIQKNPELMELIQQEEESINDLAESKLITKLNEGDNQMIKFRLTTKAKDRGYVERQEIVNSGNLSLNHTLTKEEKEELLEDLKRNEV
jgi:predicted transcriptional regulator